MKISRNRVKEIVKEVMVEENAYQEFFKKALEKTGKSIPQMSDEEKKTFFNKIDSAWNGKGEKKESVSELTAAQEKLPPALKKAIEDKEDTKDESVNERIGSDKGEVGNANFMNRRAAFKKSQGINKGDNVIVNYPNLKAPIKGKVTQILKSNNGNVYVIGKDGVWDEKYVTKQ